MQQNPEIKLESIANRDMKENGWYCTWEQESVSEAITKVCACKRWIMVELALEADMAPKVHVSSMDVSVGSGL